MNTSQQADAHTAHSARNDSHKRWTAGLWPAFQDTRTGETHLAMLANGERSTHHSFEGLPASWIIERDASGLALTLHPAIQAGYWRSPDFFALGSTLTLPLDA